MNIFGKSFLIQIFGNFLTFKCQFVLRVRCVPGSLELVLQGHQLLVREGGPGTPGFSRLTVTATATVVLVCVVITVVTCRHLDVVTHVHVIIRVKVLL